MKILVIEDEKELAQAIREYFRKDDQVCECAFNRDEATEKLNLYDYDCILVDIGLPDGSGLDIIRDLKHQQVDTGIIIISARNSLDDKIDGLNIGADDYLTKPFYLSELNARVKSIIRRKSFSGGNEIVFEEIRIIPDQMVVSVCGHPVDLTRKEYDLLTYFLANKNRVLNKESIAEHLWGDNMDMADSFEFLYNHIKNLRKKIVEKGGKNYIRTVYGIGYKFSSSVS